MSGNCCEFTNNNQINVNSGILRLSGGISNTGTIQTAGGVINKNSGTFNNELAGVLRAGNGDITVSGGTTTNSGTFEALAGNAITFAQFAVAPTNNVSGTLTGGTWRSIGSGAVISINGNPITNNAADITLSGAGSVFQTRDGSTENFTALEDSLVQTDASGALRILDNRHYTTANAYTNDGITQLGGGTFDTAGSTNNTGGEIFGFGSLADQVANSGTVRATGGTLIALKGVDGTSGTVQIDADGIMDFNSAPSGSNAGTLTHNGSGAGSLNLGANDITVHNDYTNANFGVGNSFNHRTNVSGSGQIIASGDVAQTITGSDVTGGGTATPTVTFGNVHVGDVDPDHLTLTYRIANTGSSRPVLRGAIQTTVNGGNITDLRLSGTGVTAANFGPIATGADSGDLIITLTTSDAGALTGQKIHIENNFDNVAGQDIWIVDSAVYRLAEASIDNTADFAFGSVHVGDTVEQAVSITNTTVNDGFSEGLNAGFDGTSDVRITTNGGSFNLLAADATDNTSMVVGVNTLAAGNVNGTATLSFASNGEGTSDLGITALPSQDLTVTASISLTAYRLANPYINTDQPVVFGNVRVGDVVGAQALSITNDVPNDGLSEKLNASADGTTGGVVTNGGSFSLLAAQETDNTSITVSINTSTAGDKSGIATIDFESDGTGTSGLGVTPLASQDVNVTGAVYRLAEVGTHSPEPVVLADSHVGDTVEKALSMANTAVADGYSESLNAVIGSATGDATASGSFNLLTAGETDSSGLVVGVDTSTAGAKSGTASIDLESEGTGTSDIAGNVELADQTVNISGNVYRLAEAGAHSPEPVVLANVHVGDISHQQALTLGNTAVADGYSEALNAGFGGTMGDATATGSINQLGADGTDSSSLLVGIDTSTAGAKSGAATLNLESDGDGINTLGQTALAGQTVNISGNVYRLAEATIDNTADFAFGNVHVDDTVEQAVSITNAAGNDDFSEGLNAVFGGTSDGITTNGGSFSLLAAGATDNTSMVVGVDTSEAGNVNGTATLNFESDGTNTSDLGITDLLSQDLTVTASISLTAYRLANPDINTDQPVAFGNVRVGDVVGAQALSITNDVPDDGLSEKLNASADGTTGGVVTNGGSFSLLAAQDTDNTSITVSINTSTAGDKSGIATIDFESNGEGTSGLGVTTLESQDVNVTGAVYRLAEASGLSSPIVINARVGDVTEQSLSVSNTAVADGYSESLNAGFDGTTGDATATGSVNQLGAGETDNSSLVVGVNTGTAGAKTGTASIALGSDGTGTSGLAAIGIGDQSVDISGNVYAPAVASVGLTSMDFGIVHVGTVAAQSVGVTNIAPVAALNDVLTGSISADGAFIGSGDLGTGLAAGESNNTSLTVGLDTSNAGMFTDTATIAVFSSNDDMADLALSGESVGLSAQVNNYANPVFAFESGDGIFSGSGSSYELDFGTLVQNSGSFDANLTVLNDVTGPVDLLDGTFDLPASTDFLLSGFDSFFNLDAGDAFSGLSIALDTAIPAAKQLNLLKLLHFV